MADKTTVAPDTDSDFIPESELPRSAAPGGSAGRLPGQGILGTLRWSWRQLTSMRTALLLLFLLAVAAVPGSVLPQRSVDPAGVQRYFSDHPDLAPWLDRFSLFNVFAAPWFAAIYLLLFTSLAGCVLPRSWRHLRAVRGRPPAAPRHMSRLPFTCRYETDLEPGEVLSSARTELRRSWFRVEPGHDSVAAEKGFLRETGNLVFHLALLVLLFAAAAGQLFGYRGSILVTEGDGFANTISAYDSFQPGRFFDPAELPPFTFRLGEFRASYVESGPGRGQPESFDARVRYRSTPGGPDRGYPLEVNHPLVIGGTKVYLIGHGYAPTFRVLDGQGRPAFAGPVPFVPRDNRTLASSGVIKVPDAQPEQLGFVGFFTPTTAMSPRGPTSVFPAPRDPGVSLLAFRGDLGLDSGEPQPVFSLDTANLTRVKAQALDPGETMRLPDGLGSITFTGYREWVSLQVNSDPGKTWALLAALLAVAGLVISLGIRRRRVWVRARREEGRRTVVEIGGLTRTDAAGGFDEEFNRIADRIRGVSQ